MVHLPSATRKKELLQDATLWAFIDKDIDFFDIFNKEEYHGPFHKICLLITSLLKMLLKCTAVCLFETTVSIVFCEGSLLKILLPSRYKGI